MTSHGMEPGPLRQAQGRHAGGGRLPRHPANGLLAREPTSPAAWPALLREVVDHAVRLLAGIERENLQAVAVYGSVGRGKMHGARDVDLVVVLEGDDTGSCPLLLDRLHEAIAPATPREIREALSERNLPSRLELVPYTRREWEAHPSLMLDMTEDAVALWDPRGVFAREIDALRERMRSLGSRRIWTERGTWYWILKPDIKFGEVLRL